MQFFLFWLLLNEVVYHGLTRRVLKDLFAVLIAFLISLLIDRQLFLSPVVHFVRGALGRPYKQGQPSRVPALPSQDFCIHITFGQTFPLPFDSKNNSIKRSWCESRTTSYIYYLEKDHELIIEHSGARIPL